MAVWRHLFDPATDTHFANGGFIPADSEVPIEGALWVEGKPPEGAAVYDVPGKEPTDRETCEWLLSGINEGFRCYIDSYTFDKAISGAETKEERAILCKAQAETLNRSFDLPSLGH